MASSTLYRRQSMINLYDKLQAQTDDDMGWLAETASQFETEDKSSALYFNFPSVNSPPSQISSGASSSSSSPSNSPPRDYVNYELNVDSGSDSDSDVESFSLEAESHYSVSDATNTYANTTSFQDFNPIEEYEQHTDLPYLPPAFQPYSREVTPLHQDEHHYEEAQVASKENLSNISPSVLAQPPTRSNRVNTPAFSLITAHDSDEDADGESDDDVDDDEYIPSPHMDSCKRRHSGRSNPLSYQRHGTSPSSSSSSRKRPASGVSTSERLAKRPRFSPAPRNVQASLENIASSATERPTKSNPWACPHCSWVQRNHRTPDLKRHIRTHTRFQQPALWVCCGVALELSGPYVIPEDAQPYDFQGRMMIGGCGKEFSRRDALKRHLDNHNITCVGDLNNFATSYD